MSTMSDFKPYARPVALAALGGLLMGFTWALFIDGTLRSSIMPTLALLGSLLLLGFLAAGLFMLALVTWLLWRRGKKIAWRWSLVGVVALVGVIWLALALLTNQGWGASIRSMNVLSRLPEGNLLTGAGTYAWTFTSAIMLIIVISLWTKLVSIPGAVMTWWHALPPRIKAAPKQRRHRETHQSSDDDFDTLGIGDFLSDDEQVQTSGFAPQMNGASR